MKNITAKSLYLAALVSALVFMMMGASWGLPISLVPDPDYVAEVTDPAYPAGAGPIVLIDATHANKGTLTLEENPGLYAPLGELLEADGYQVQSLDSAYETDPSAYEAALADASILVVVEPHADFSEAELDALTVFFRQGLGIVFVTERPDLVPNLLARLELEFTFSRVWQHPRNCPDTRRLCRSSWNTFLREDRTLNQARRESNGRYGFEDEEAVDSVVAFDGYGLVTNPAIWPPYRTVLSFGPKGRYLADQDADADRRKIKITSADGLPFALALEGPPLTNAFAGRLFAATNFEMFTALTHEWTFPNLKDPDNPIVKHFHPIGFQVRGAEQNEQFTLNVFHWLDRNLDPSIPSGSGQRPDPTYVPDVDDPLYEPGTGPLILYDHAHNNFHRISPGGRYEPFRKLAEADGYNFEVATAKWNTQAFLDQLASADVVMTANPPVQLTEAEAAVIVDWVSNGGSLFVVIDHPPYDKVDNLAAALGLGLAHDGSYVPIEQLHPFSNTVALSSGYVEFTIDPVHSYDGFIVDSHPVIEGRNLREEVRLVRTFYGTQFRLIAPLPDVFYDSQLVLPPGAFSNAGDYGGWSMGMAIEVGAGRIYVQSEAASLTAQISANWNQRFGMQIPYAEDNEQYVLNILHWLDGTLTRCAYADAGPDRVICPNDSTTLGTPARPGHTYEWHPGGETTAEITVSPSTTTTYTVSATNTCDGETRTDTDSATVFVIQDDVAGLSEDFETGAEAWTATGLWHLADPAVCGDPAPITPSTAFYYGRDASCTYDNGVAASGELTSPIIIGITPDSELSFNHWLDISPYNFYYNVYDTAEVEIIDSEGLSKTVFSISGADPPAATWTPVTIPIGDFAGRAIQVHFRFSSVRRIYGTTPQIGWFIDDVVVTSGIDCTP